VRLHHLFHSTLSKAPGILRIAVPGAVLALGVLTPVAAFASSTSAARPAPATAHQGTTSLRAVGPNSASGGGCAEKVLYAQTPQGNIPIVYEDACISENPARQIASDAHVPLVNAAATHCRFVISIRDDTLGYTVNRQTFDNNCTSYEVGPVLYGAVRGHAYHTYVWTYVWIYGTILHWDTAALAVNSPEQIAG